MDTSILANVVGMAIVLIFTLWIWWTLRIQEIVSTGEIARLPDRVRRNRGYDLHLPTEDEKRKPAKYWRFLPLSILAVALIKLVTVRSQDIANSFIL